MSCLLYERIDGGMLLRAGGWVAAGADDVVDRTAAWARYTGAEPRSAEPAHAEARALGMDAMGARPSRSLMKSKAKII
jgi:hypothetical protein